jgi:hypothetical protein
MVVVTAGRKKLCSLSAVEGRRLLMSRARQSGQMREEARSGYLRLSHSQQAMLTAKAKERGEERVLGGDVVVICA